MKSNLVELVSFFPCIPTLFWIVSLVENRSSFLPFLCLQPRLKQGPPTQLVFVGSRCGNSGSLGTLSSLFCPLKSAESQWARGLYRLAFRTAATLAPKCRFPANLMCKPRTDAAKSDVGVTSSTHRAPSVLLFPLTPFTDAAPRQRGSCLAVLPRPPCTAAVGGFLLTESSTHSQVYPVCFVWLGIERNFRCQT